jgi:hypothetical protein
MNFPSSGILRGVSWFKTDVSWLPISSIFQVQACLFKMRPIGSPETLILNHLTSRNILEDGSIQVNFFLENLGLGDRIMGGGGSSMNMGL